VVLSVSLQKWKITEVANVSIIFLSFITVIGRSQWLHSLSYRPMAVACLGCGFESPQGLGCLFLVSVACCQVEVSVMGCHMWHVNVIMKLW